MEHFINYLYKVLLFAGLIMLISGCDSRDGEPDMEQQQTLYLALTAPTQTDLNEICTKNAAHAFTCATETGIPGGSEMYVGFKEAMYKVDVPFPATKENYCETVIPSADFPVPVDESIAPADRKTYSTGAKVCFLTCEGGFWERSISQGDCTAEKYSTLNYLDDQVQKDCLEDCLKTGTVFLP
jgi:hypothetical protein